MLVPESMNEGPVNTPIPTSAPPPHHLHSLTERKLERAVLGRAVGLRQLVLLSNAFATRPSPPPLPTISTDEHTLRYPHASTSRHSAFDEDEELDAGLIDYEEDEAERKRREEDWLDSVLDEMLTDAEDDEDADDQQEDRAGQLKTPTRSEREFKEPYVHLSIKHAWQSYASSSSPASYPPSPSSVLAPQHAAMLDKDTVYDDDHLQNITRFPVREQYWPSDSGFMEPHSIPLPESTDSSPISSANSQASDDGAEDVQIEYYEQEEQLLEEEQCEACQAAGERWEVQQELWFDPQDDTESGSYPQVGIPISLTRGRSATTLASPHSFTSLSLPELAYSATSLNTLSSSPSHSFDLFTPGTSPSALAGPASTSASSEQHMPTPSHAEREKQAWRDSQARSPEIDYEASTLEPQEIMLPMDDLDLYDDEGSSASPEGDEESNSSNGSSTSTEDRTRQKRTTVIRKAPSHELVRYQPAKEAKVDAANEEYGLRIPLYLPSASFTPKGLFCSRPPRSRQDSLPMQPLPPSLLSVMMGKDPVVGLELPSVDTTPIRPSHSHDGRIEDRLKLPIFLPSEIVKSLYDSVDFGLPPRFTSPTSSPLSSPSRSPLALPFEFSASSDITSTVHEKATARTRSKSLTQVDPPLHPPTHACSGGLLFSSLGLFALGNDSQITGTTSGIWDQGYASERRRSLSSTPLYKFTDSGLPKDLTLPSTGSSNRSRTMLHNAAGKNESRSPSRLRLFLDHGDSSADDFEFGSI